VRLLVRANVAPIDETKTDRAGSWLSVRKFAMSVCIEPQLGEDRSFRPVMESQVSKVQNEERKQSKRLPPFPNHDTTRVLLNGRRDEVQCAETRSTCKQGRNWAHHTTTPLLVLWTRAFQSASCRAERANKTRGRLVQARGGRSQRRTLNGRIEANGRNFGYGAFIIKSFSAVGWIQHRGSQSQVTGKTCVKLRSS